MLINEKIYLKNIELYEKKYNKLLNNHTDNNEYSINVNQAKLGNYSMMIEKEDTALYINSRYNPLEEAKRWADSFEIKRNSKIILFGFGLGYHIMELSKKLSNNNLLIVIEPNIQVFNEALKYNDFTNIINNRQIDLVVGKTAGEIKAILYNDIHWVELESIIYNHIPNYEKLFINDYKNLLLNIKDLKYSLLASKNTAFFFSKQWQLNLIDNLPHIVRSQTVSKFFNKFSNIPAIIVSAGPSLSKNIQHLHALKEHAVIIAVGTSLKALLKANIKPDFVLSIDGGEPNYKHFEGLDYDDIPLIYTSTLYPDILNNHKGKKIFFKSNENYTDYLFKINKIDVGFIKMGGSVANSAFDFAVKIGANPVIFVGQDLAFIEGRTHSKGTTYEDDFIDKNETDENFLFVKDINGKDILTSKSLYEFLVWFENEIARDKTDRLYIDATEGGAYIKGTTVMTLQNVQQKYCNKKIDITNKINEILLDIKELDLSEIESELNNTLSVMYDLRQLCKKGHYLSSDLLDIYKLNQSKNVDNKINKLNEIDTALKKEINRFNLIKHSLQPIIYNVLNSVEVENNTNQKNRIKSAELSMELYEEIKEAIDIIIPALKDTIDKLK